MVTYHECDECGFKGHTDTYGQFSVDYCPVCGTELEDGA